MRIEPLSDLEILPDLHWFWLFLSVIKASGISVARTLMQARGVKLRKGAIGALLLALVAIPIWIFGSAWAVTDIRHTASYGVFTGLVLGLIWCIAAFLMSDILLDSRSSFRSADKGISGMLAFLFPSLAIQAYRSYLAPRVRAANRSERNYNSPAYGVRASLITFALFAGVILVSSFKSRTNTTDDNSTHLSSAGSALRYYSSLFSAASAEVPEPVVQKTLEPDPSNDIAEFPDLAFIPGQ
jgi:hypothetical protein